MSDSGWFVGRSVERQRQQGRLTGCNDIPFTAVSRQEIRQAETAFIRSFHANEDGHDA